MKFYLYYDENLIFSILSQLDLEGFDIDFFSVSIEEKNDINQRISVNPNRKFDKCNCGFSYSTDIFEGRKVEHIYANIEDIKDVRRKKFLYNAIDKIIEKIKEEERIFYYEGDIPDNMKLLCNVEDFKVGREQFKICNCERLVTIGYKIKKDYIKPICIYLKC